MTLDATTVIIGQLASATAPCVTSSFQAECVVLVHMLRAHRPDIPVLFVDTAHHFAETYAYRDRLAREWNLNLINVGSAAPQLGLWQRSTDACCAWHKVGPLFAALEGYDTWFTALRREQSPSRADLEGEAPFRLPTGTTLRKLAPLAGWTMRDVETYAYVNEIPLLPLYAQGYTSIGCEPCTRPPSDASNPRSGRWLGQKLECGIHIPAPPV
ncbi:MAG TPA: phosphoadenylyl-sulfate reductase [Gemmatimonadaceae bacterium]|nr:phosphoadenylyl-sulfate reductase [Gemmatimonadaceae bacterium]